MLLAAISAGLFWLNWCSRSIVPYVYRRHLAWRPYSLGQIYEDSDFIPVAKSQRPPIYIEEKQANLEHENSRSATAIEGLGVLDGELNRNLSTPSLEDQKPDTSLENPSGRSPAYEDKTVPFVRNGASSMLKEPYHQQTIFQEDFQEMRRKLKIFVYPHNRNDPFSNIFLPENGEPSGNYASESYFKKSLMNSSFLTTNASEANMFYLPFSIAGLRNDKRVGVKGLPGFVASYINNVRQKWPYWNKTSGADHFFVSCHSITKIVSDNVVYLRMNVIQVVCSSNIFVQGYIPHKDVSIPQVWPRKGTPDEAKLVDQRQVLAFFAGAGNSPVRAAVVKSWSHDSEILVYSNRLSTSYSKALLTSKFCLHVKGFEVNTARIADAMHFGCVPVILANHYDLPFANVLNWDHISIVVSTSDIPLLKEILKAVTPEQYKKLQMNVMQVRKHFHWNTPSREYDAFYMVMYELWSRRHVLRPAI